MTRRRSSSSNNNNNNSLLTRIRGSCRVLLGEENERRHHSHRQ